MTKESTKAAFARATGHLLLNLSPEEEAEVTAYEKSDERIRMEQHRAILNLSPEEEAEVTVYEMSDEHFRMEQQSRSKTQPSTPTQQPMSIRKQIWCNTPLTHWMCSGYRFDLLDGAKVEGLCLCYCHDSGEFRKGSLGAAFHGITHASCIGDDPERFERADVISEKLNESVFTRYTNSYSSTHKSE